MTRWRVGADGLRVIVAIPVFNDWEALTLMLEELDRALASSGMIESTIAANRGCNGV